MRLPIIIPKRVPAFVPYIYSGEEVRRLLQATDSYQRIRSCTEPITVRTIILLLYGTGIRVREALFLSSADVDLSQSVLAVRQTKFFKSRLVPFGSQLTQPLVKYASRHAGSRSTAARSTAANGASFFTTRTGDPVNQRTLEGAFRRVCEHAGVRRSDEARYQPRLHDLRHSFAVTRLISWYRQGKDVQKLLPMLSVYLGHVHVGSTQVYLSMTPELLREASRLFERYAGEKAEAAGHA